jgi:hypothetical protein
MIIGGGHTGDQAAKKYRCLAGSSVCPPHHRKKAVEILGLSCPWAQQLEGLEATHTGLLPALRTYQALSWHQNFTVAVENVVL